jgi:N-acetylmuramoyl-L-alanine amidase
MEPKPPNSRGKSRPPQRAVEDLPIFSTRREVRPGPPRKPGGRRFSFRTFVAFVGLMLLLTGAVMLVPRGPDAEFAEPRAGSSGLPTVVVDAGHGGHDNGASRNGLFEKNLTLDTALRLERKLRKLGFPVVMTRRDDRFVELAERSEVANRIPRALFVSVHFNDNVSAVGEGVETFYASAKTPASAPAWSPVGWFKEKPEPSPADNGLGLARAVQGAIVSELGAVNRGVKPAGYAVVRLTRCPAVLVEGGFINNPARARAIARPEYRERLAGAIAEGVAAYHREHVLKAQKGRLAAAR